MTTPLAANNVVETRIYVQEAEQVSINVLHWKILTVGVSPSNDGDLAQQLSSNLAAPLKAIMFNSSLFAGIAAQIIWPLPLQVPANYTADSGIGTAGVTGLPRQTAGFIRWKSALAGRHGHGRTYWPFPSASDNALGGVPTASYKANLTTLGAAILGTTVLANGGRSATIQQVIWDRVGHIATPITTFLALQEWATQRRRSTFGRANSLPF